MEEAQAIQNLVLQAQYFHQMEKLGANPNFFMSSEYIARAGWKFRIRDTVLEAVDSDGHVMLPALCQETVIERAWASTIDPPEGLSRRMDFLDHQFIYDPHNFADLSGRKWRTTRKNMEEARADVEEGFVYYVMDQERSNALDKFLSDWASAQEDMYDPEVMVDFLLNGKHRLLIVGERSLAIYGELVWDSNYRYTNFRYCVVRPGVRGLSDTCRVMFYRYMDGLGPWLVNDGGSLGRPSLYDYKMRLNPIEVGKIYTWRTI